MFGIETIVHAAAIAAMARYEWDKKIMESMTPEQKESCIARRAEQQEFAMRFREVDADAKKSDSGFGTGALFLAFIFGSSL